MATLILAHVAEAAPEQTSDLRRPSRDSASSAASTACSLRHPLCVHATSGTSPDTILATLADADRAWDIATGPLALPPPDLSWNTRAYDVYLVDATSVSDVATVAEERDPLARFDRANALTFIDSRLTGCARSQAAARGLLRAISYRIAPAIDPGSAEAQTAYLADLVAPCPTLEAAARGTFQRHPERALADAWPEWDGAIGTSYARGAALFYDWMDGSFGQEPGSIVRALWALTPSLPSSGRQSGPDAFDVLRVSFKNAWAQGSSVDDLLLGFAAARMQASPRARTDWEIDWPSTPRRLAPRDPTAPTGSAYVVIRRAGAPAGARLRVEATWEEHAKMRWTVLKLDRNGNEMARIPIASSERATEAQGSIVDVDAADTLAIIGMNAGDFAFPFDPDDAIWEPHGWRLTVASE